jgi:erythromycin esterase-like protein
MMNQTVHLEDYLHPIEGRSTDYDTVLKCISEAELVLIGESTHGTHEFYQIRAEITKRLICEQGFNAVAIEGDWPDTYRINRYVKNDPTIQTGIDAVRDFIRFPTWMWRNQVVVDFIEWLHHYNANIAEPQKIGFYGIDLYSLNTSVKVVLDYLQQTDVNAAARAQQRYACFDPFKHELQSYGYAAMFGRAKSCEEAVTAQLIDLDACADIFLKNGDKRATEEFFNVKQNAYLIKSAEKYYRSMFSSHVCSWNVRDTYMAETIDHLIHSLTNRLQQPAKIIIWAHNSHIGDASATESGHQGQINIGQLIKQTYGNKAALIGFLTHSGTVTAASHWDGVAERKSVRPALPNSYEHFFHHFPFPAFTMCFHQNKAIKKYLPSNLLQRAIGVIYLPQTERFSHYFYTDLNKQFDVVIYLDRTTALTPLETTAIWHQGEVFETFPSGL